MKDRYIVVKGIDITISKDTDGYNFLSTDGYKVDNESYRDLLSLLRANQTPEDLELEKSLNARRTRRVRGTRI